MKKKKWFKNKKEEEVIKQCKIIWSAGGTNAEASWHAKISQDELERFLFYHPEIVQEKADLQNKPKLHARTSVAQALLNNPDFSLKFLEKTQKKF
jgi:hypothetical protein